MVPAAEAAADEAALQCQYYLLGKLLSRHTAIAQHPMHPALARSPPDSAM